MSTGTMSSAMQECRWALEDLHSRIDELHDGNNATSKERVWARRLADHLDAWDDDGDDHAPPPASTPGKAFQPALAALAPPPANWEWRDLGDGFFDEDRTVLVPRIDNAGDDSTGFEDLLTSSTMMPATVPASAMVTTGDDDLGF